MADPGVFANDARRRAAVQVNRFDQLYEQEQWTEALKIGEFL